jgi:phosphatidylglycerol:prolipoprotein diacylglycerol transferase
MPAPPVYSLFMVLALAVFLIARQLTARPPALQALPWPKRLGLVLAGFVGGAFGSRLPFILVSSETWQGSLLVVPGKTITTALIGAYLAVEAAKLVMGVRVKTGDTFAVPLALALSVGRWGCFCGGCCYGVPTELPWGVDFGDGIRRHPTQVYEVLFHLSMALILWRVIRAGALPCQRLKLYLIAYGVFRFATEFIRPEPPLWLGLTFYQWVALLMIVGLSVQWLVDSPQRLGIKIGSGRRPAYSLETTT